MSENNIFLTDTPVKPSKAFVGRDKDIEKIRTALQSDSPICLYGMGGIGKTEICRKIFWDLSECMDGTIKYLAWIKYTSDLKSSFYEKFIEPNSGGSTFGTDVRSYYENVIRRINQYGRELLLIIDDINGISKDEQNTINSLSCFVLLTSRKKIDGMRCFEIGCIESEDDCVNMYKCYRDMDNDDNDKDEMAIREMVRLSGHHTITIELLGKLQAAGFMKAHELLIELKNEGFMLEKNDAEVETASFNEQTIKKHLEIIFDISKINDENEKKILGTMSLLEPNISVDIELPLDLAEISDKNAVNHLCRVSWLGRDGSKSISIHPVVSDVIRDKLTNSEDIDHAAEKLAEKAKRAAEDNEPLKMNELLPHCCAVLKHLENKVDVRAALLYSIGFMQWRLGVYKDAAEKLNESAEIYRRSKGTSKETADAVHLLGLVYQYDAKYDNAEAYYNEALNIRLELFGEDAVETAISYNDIGSLIREKGNHEHSLSLYQKALKIRLEKLGEDDKNTATTYNNIGGVYNDIGPYPIALKYYEKALNIRKGVLGTEHPDTAAAYNNIANVYIYIKKYDTALEYHIKALNIAENVLGTDHPDTAAAYNNIANVYIYMEKYDTALEYHIKALNIREKVLGKDHPYTANSYNNIGGVYNGIGNYAIALEYYEKALNIREGVLGTDHPDTANTYYNIGCLYYRKKEYRKALEWFEKALTIFKRKLGNEHQDTIDTKQFIKSVKDDMKRYGTIHNGG